MKKKTLIADALAAAILTEAAYELVAASVVFYN
jgi:hypothetical protein